jgi:AraC-like DNA-binding protein
VGSVRIGVAPNEVDVDELAVQCICAVELAASALELTDLGTGVHGAVFAVGPVDAPLARFRVIKRVERWVRKDLLSGHRVVKIHPRVRRVLKYIRENLASGADLSLKTLADVSGPSPSRLMHAFTASVGVPVRPYILWLRLQRASYELMNGVTVTETAHIAGFSDAAHLTRTFRRMLGTTPMDLAGRKTMSEGLSIQRAEAGTVNG